MLTVRDLRRGGGDGGGRGRGEEEPLLLLLRLREDRDDRDNGDHGPQLHRLRLWLRDHDRGRVDGHQGVCLLLLLGWRWRWPEEHVGFLRLLAVVTVVRGGVVVMMVAVRVAFPLFLVLVVRVDGTTFSTTTEHRRARWGLLAG